MPDRRAGSGSLRTDPTATPSSPAVIPALWLALIAGPLSFGIAGPSLVLDDIAGDLGTGRDTVTWAVTAFGWGIAVGTPLLAGLTRHRGLRTGLITCAALIALGAALVATIPVLTALIIGCALQALGTAGLTSIAMTLAGSPRRMGLVTASLAVVGSTSPLVGSLVNDVLGWQATLALPAISLLGVPVVMARAELAASAERFDLIGAALLTGLVTALVLVPHRPLPAAVASGLVLAALVAHVRSRPRGFLPAAVVGDPRFLLPSLLALGLAVVNFGLLYAIPDLLNDSAGWSTSQIGAAMVWPLLLGGGLSWFVVAASARIGRSTITVVLVAMAVTASIAAPVSGWVPVLLGAQALASIAAASGQGVFAVHATDRLPDDDRTAGIGLFNLCYLLGAAFGPAIVALLVS
ncbi:major facilitator superfamily MFS_1 [Kribbella flavida DSM 17836]|uniref:Major facilitator superfamily MFS_1 n=1 Tax=Kribbella flavida (strain DSM 17836 / JCM 10339 / NBRC 14399) TaxID=479435 RepID=D2PZR2_KRIFD|nr:MFS transporter [Kribbella flavida]ADB35628.1 major facilitator superfamily MFS_1 [Kribbella flavida DSM 17836]